MKERTITVKLVGGPMAGRTLTVPASVEKLNIGGFFQYVFGGKDGKTSVFVIRPRKRVVWRAIMEYIGRTGRHPGTQYDERKPVPHRGRTNKRGQGARRRAERKTV